ncbi:serine/threonine-protein kinase ATM [Contarinia nasturtii]|uniref:serine/threonine-protein kinase ATM n=1 Tax=Contarinia nasturtii TaxID=265458 RepID=UPI0012D48C82|nr:serine/threonine-protein kinase ATM [Contarinia nasturtii]
MSSATLLLIQIRQQLIDIKNDKITVRSKSLDELHNIFDNRAHELRGIFRLNSNNHHHSDEDETDTFNWSELFDGLHDAVKDQCMRIEAGKRAESQKNSLLAKNDSYKSLLRKCVSLANEYMPNISYAKICHAAFECFETPTICCHFDGLYLQIVKKDILNAKHSLSELKLAEWSRLLSHIFELYKQNRIQKNELLQCIPLILQHGSKYRYLVSDLHQYLPDIVQIINEGQFQNHINAQKHILHIVYEFIRNLAMNQRLSVVAFTEKVLDKLLKFYQFSMDADFKVNLMKIMHVSIVVHSPEPNSMVIDRCQYATSNQIDDLFQINVAEDMQVWHKHLRNMISIVEREITESRKRSMRSKEPPTISHVFVRMAAKLCSVVFWKDDVWNSSGEEQRQKRLRQAMKLERIFELIEYESTKFCWRWFAILSQMLVDFPHVLQAEDYQPLLKLLYDFKPTIQHSLHMKHYIRIVDVMLRKEHELKKGSTLIRDSYCVEYWRNIMTLSFKHAATDKMQLENLDLMRILIENDVIVSYNFIKDVISEVTKMSNIKKSNSSIKLLISILGNVNTDMIHGITNLKIAVIKWLSSKIKLSELKKVIENNNRFDDHLIADLYVLCVLSRQENGNNKSHKLDTDVMQEDADAFDHDLFIADIVKNLQYRMLSKLIVTDTIHANEKPVTPTINELPEKNDVKAFVNDTIFVELEKAIHDTDGPSENSTSPDDNSLDCFHNIASSLAININILNTLVGYESIDSDFFRKFLTKRIFFKIGQLNVIVEKFDASLNIDQNPNEVNEIVDGLLSIWHDKYHPIIEHNMFIVSNSIHIINWLKVQLKPSLHDESLVLTPIQKISQLSFEERIQLKCLQLLAHFSAYDDENDTEVHVLESISEYTFNYKRNQDIFILFHLIKIILSQLNPSEALVEWAFDEIKKICTNLSSQHDYMEMVVDNIPALVKCVKPHVDLHDDLINLLTSFLKQIKSKKYGPRISIKVIQSVQYFAQEFFEAEDCFVIIAFLQRFLQSEYITIQFTAVQCLTNIFNKKCLNYDEERISCVTVQNFHTNLMEKLEIDQLSVEQENDRDRKMCIVSTRLQLYCSIIGVCYPLRRQTWFNLIELCGQQLNMDQIKIVEIATKLCKDVFQTTHTTLLADLFPFLIASWIDKNIHMTTFPEKLLNFQTQADFLVEYMDTITLQVLLYKQWYLPDLLEMDSTNNSLLNMLSTNVITECLAYYASIQVSDQDKTGATNMMKILKEQLPQIAKYFDTHSLEIIEKLLKHMWDEVEFRAYFDTEVEFISDKQTIDYNIFMKSLQFLQRKAFKSSNLIHLYCEMMPKNVVNTLYSLKLELQRSICEEIKMCQMFRVCVFIDIIVDFLIENANKKERSDVIGFFVRDFIYFIGNTITSECSDKFKLATCKYFRKFCEKILPTCAEYFQNHLNYIVSMLMPMAKSKSQTKISIAAMDLLQFLIISQKTVLKTAIGKLDSFPKQVEFNELCKIQNEMKYNGKSFTLLEEIEYFLSVDKRKVEGLLSLKEHLSKKKQELQEIYKTIYETRGFSEDCEKSPIHRLISALLAHIVQNVDSEKSLIAAKCLGELGPSDLGSIALKFDVQLQTYKICNEFDEAVSNLCEHAMDKLNGIFIHSDATVLQAAAEASIHLLESSKASEFLVQYPLLGVFETSAVRQIPLKLSENNLDFEKLFNDNAFHSSHSIWVKQLAVELFTLFGNEPLAHVAAKQTSFSTAMVPLLIKTLLTTKNANYYRTLEKAIKSFFQKTFENLSANKINEIANTPVYLNKVSIRLMLNVAECVRMHNQALFGSAQNLQVNLNNLHIAKAALFCEAHFTAILYGELSSYESDETEIQSIMKSAYQSIGEIDAVSAFLDPIKHKTQYLEVNRCWNKLLIGVDAQTDGFTEYSRYLSEAGLYNLANKLNMSNNSRNYECAWRLQDWGIAEGSADHSCTTNQDPTNEFDKYHYFALKSVQQRDQIGTKINVKRAFEGVIKMFKQSSYECTKNIYKNLMMLHLLQQIEEFSGIQFPNSDEENYEPDFVINKWKYQDQIASCGFNYREPILAQRITLLESAGVRAKRNFEKVFKFGDGIDQMILNLVSECREEGFYNLGERYLSTLYKKKLNREMNARAYIEDAQLNWSQGESEMAQKLIENIIKDMFPSFTRAKAIGMMGEYLAEARLEDTKTIINDYFVLSNKTSGGIKKSSDAIKPDSHYYYPPEVRERRHLENKKRNYHAIAKYADLEYQQIAAYKKSSEFEKKMTNIQKNRAILSEMKKKKMSLTKDEQKTYMQVDKVISIDDTDVKSTNTEYMKYLHMAVDGYIQSLLLESENEANNSTMFRLFSLWFSNSNDQVVLTEIQDSYSKIPTYKFIPLMPQITTHLSTDGIHEVISDIILRCALQHPHHVLPKVLALVNAFKDDRFIEDVNSKSAISSSPRTDAAAKLLQIMKGYSALRDIICEMERMCEVLIQLANVEVKTAVREFGPAGPIRHLRDLDLIHCPTVHLPISISGDYTKTKVGIHKWKNTFDRPGGINAPKRIECIGSNGRQYSQLLKGKDDLRQDAVMQQVFNIMNDMLNQSKITNKDRLHVRTYIIVPLSQRSGILEWCENTMPLTDYLVGNSKSKGAHERFRPNDWTPKECRAKLSQTPLRKTPMDDIFKNYKKICEKIKPVFHHFFLEHYHNPGVWFERRMAYAHSLATTSMIGYILGIGDRHVSNILIDKTTAELIHIDFGIAFEQGKCLPTPELIPFRLTRDLVSALGPSGVEGIYRKSCEKTMEVLRQNKSTILTIVEVLLHDPLYTWALTSNQASKRQQTHVQINEEDDLNTLAQRALSRLEEKLNGKHVSRSDAISVKRHVEILIKEAMNEKLLCRLFVGWQPYL